MSEEKQTPDVQTDVADFKPTKIAQQWKYVSPLIGCRFDPTGKYVFTAAQDQLIQRWDLASGEYTTLDGHESWLRAMGFSPDGQTLFSAGYDGRLVFWDLSQAIVQQRKTIDAHDGWVRWLSVSPDGKQLATAGNDNLVKLWSTESAELLQTLVGHESHVYSTLYHPDGEFLLSGELQGKVHQWELSSGKSVRTFDAKDLHTYNGGQQAHYGGVRSMALSPDGKHLACSGLHNASNPFGAVQEPLVLVFDWESGEKVQSHLANGVPQGIAWRVLYLPDGYLMGISGGGSGGFLLFWKLEQAKEIHQLKLPNTALDFDLHADQTRVATVHYDRHVRICEVARG